MQESLEISNFCGIRHAVIEFKPVTVFIGESGTGKSVAMKLRYLFRKIITVFNNEKIFALTTGKESHKSLEEIAIYIFSEYQMLDINDKTKIVYKNEHQIIKLLFDSQSNYRFEFMHFESPNNRILETHAHEYHASQNNRNRLFSWEYYEVLSQYFIPEQRTFFAQFDNSIFSLARSGNALNRFLLDYGEIYRSAIFHFNIINPAIQNNIKHFIQGRIEILNGNFIAIIYEDGRPVKLDFSASGHQNIILILLALEELRRSTVKGDRKLFYIEEPEISLFPTAQNQLIKKFIELRNQTHQGTEYVITTHSPYILTALNNLALAGKIIREHPEKSDEVYQIIPESHILPPVDLAAYEFTNGTAHSLMDPETGTIIAENIDQVSGILGNEMDALFRIWHEDM